VILLLAVLAAPPPTILTNHLGYDLAGPKRALVQGRAEGAVSTFAVEDVESGERVLTGTAQPAGTVAGWGEAAYWTLDFSALQREGRYRLVAGDARSFPFRVRPNLLERHTLSDVLYYFKGQRASGPLDQADRSLPFEGRTEGRVDAHGGWYDATGDYGKHLSHLSFSTYFNPQQLSLTAWGLLKTHELLQQRGDPTFRQYLRRLMDEGAWGADYLVRVKAPEGSFYRSVSAPGPGKRPEDRRIGRDSRGFAIKTEETRDSLVDPRGTLRLDDLGYQSSLRAGAGLAIAALARAAAMDAPGERKADYLRAAEEAWAFLAKHNALLTNDRQENIVDDYCALLAASELFLATSKAEHKAAADARAQSLMARWTRDRAPIGYFRADGKDRPFFHAADAGLPVVSLVAYLAVVRGDEARRKAVLDVVRQALESELALAAEVPNPFGYPRQRVVTKAGVRETRFFFPPDTDTAPWWQGENARLGSLSFAARLALPHFTSDAAFAARLRSFAQDQLNWILGLNPFDSSMLHGQGRRNPEYMFFGSYEYTNAPGGIVNGVTGGFRDPRGIDFNLPHTATGADNDWRWGEQWLPHATWYLLAVAAGDRAPARPVVIAYVFPQERVLSPGEIAAEKITHINYAFANIKDGKVVEGFGKDAENFKVLAGLRQRRPHLKVLVSVGGWTWSGGFSDMALSPEGRRAFVESAVEFSRRHDLDGVDIDWEYPGLKGFGNPHRPEDKANFTALMAELRAALDQDGARRGRPQRVTFAAGAFPDFLAHTEMAKVQASVDFVNLMTYDFRESEGDPLAGHHANLYTHPADPKQLSADRAVRDFLAAGVPREKLVLGVPFYGRTWGQVEPKGQGLYQAGKPVKPPVDARYGNLVTKLVGREGYERVWDPVAQAPFLWNAAQRIFITYEDPESLRRKCAYVRERGLAGVMFWEYSVDPTGALLDTISRELAK
jgi:GH18 family chitinase